LLKTAQPTLDTFIAGTCHSRPPEESSSSSTIQDTEVN
jgi:hypothetical protein